MRSAKALSPTTAAYGKGAPVAGSQTLWRGLNLLEAVTHGPATLSELTKRLGLNRSTVHRLASALVKRGYLRLVAGEGYTLGNKLLELGDAVHLGVLDGGRALMLDLTPEEWRFYYRAEAGARGKSGAAAGPWIEQMTRYAASGHTFDLEENEDRVRCVGAPVRDDSGDIVAAVSVSSVAQYMTDARMAELVGTVTDTANAISRELGWQGARKRT